MLNSRSPVVWLADLAVISIRVVDALQANSCCRVAVSNSHWIDVSIAITFLNSHLSFSKNPESYLASSIFGHRVSEVSICTEFALVSFIAFVTFRADEVVLLLGSRLSHDQFSHHALGRMVVLQSRTLARIALAFFASERRITIESGDALLTVASCGVVLKKQFSFVFTINLESASFAHFMGARNRFLFFALVN